VIDFLRRLSTAQLRALHRAAKHPKKGPRPFFSDPRNMMTLRDELARRNEGD
jgi:hypothetical protein